MVGCRRYLLHYFLQRVFHVKKTWMLSRKSFPCDGMPKEGRTDTIACASSAYQPEGFLPSSGLFPAPHGEAMRFTFIKHYAIANINTFTPEPAFSSRRDRDEEISHPPR